MSDLNNKRIDELFDDLTIIHEPQLLAEIQAAAVARLKQQKAQDTEWQEAQQDLVAVEMSEEDFEREFEEPRRDEYQGDVCEMTPQRRRHRARAREEDDDDEQVKPAERKKRRLEDSRTSVCETS